MASVIQPLPAGPMDIIGDVHGELDALQALLRHLGYDEHGNHPQGRHLVFVGDLVDRGLDCPGVIRTVQHLVCAGNAFAVLGNHELNVLLGQAKDGTGWFLAAAREKDRKYGNYRCCPEEDREAVLSFLGSLPLALVRDDIRVVHAAWDAGALAEVAHLQTHETLQAFTDHEAKVIEQAKSEGLFELAASEKAGSKLSDKSIQPPMLHALARLESMKQMGNPIKRLTSGIERPGAAPFYSSGSWRFVERVKWWNDYDEIVPVVIGHYWRRIRPTDRAALGKGDPDLFTDVQPNDWHGKHRNVFCIDYSVGGRWSERAAGVTGPSEFKLGALRWPERTVMLDDGSEFPTDAH